jgi:hypothetical protein
MPIARHILAYLLLGLYLCSAGPGRLEIQHGQHGQHHRQQAAFAEYTSLQHHSLSLHTPALYAGSATTKPGWLPFPPGYAKPVKAKIQDFLAAGDLTSRLHFLHVRQVQRYFPVSLMHLRKANLIFPFHNFW